MRIAATTISSLLTREYLRLGLSKSLMNTHYHVMRNRVSPAALSIALLICSAVWFVSAWIYYTTGISRNEWFATPLLWTLLVMVAPATCFSIVIQLLHPPMRWQLSRLHRCALAAAFLPVTLGTVLAIWAAKALISTAAVGS